MKRSSTDFKTWSRSRCRFTHFTMCCHLQVRNDAFRTCMTTKNNNNTNINCWMLSLRLKWKEEQGAFSQLIHFAALSTRLTPLNVIFEDSAIHEELHGGICADFILFTHIPKLSDLSKQPFSHIEKAKRGYHPRHSTYKITMGRLVSYMKSGVPKVLTHIYWHRSWPSWWASRLLKIFNVLEASATRSSQLKALNHQNHPVEFARVP